VRKSHKFPAFVHCPEKGGKEGGGREWDGNFTKFWKDPTNPFEKQSIRDKNT
jgi:hypothetical protein